MAIDKTIKRIAGDVVKIPGLSKTTGGTKFSPVRLPWNKHDDDFFSPIKLDPKKAEGLYPYRLVVIDVKNGNKIVSRSGKGTDKNNIEFIKHKYNTGGVIYKLSTVANKWEFILPITPQQLSISDQFAINTTATLRGIVEEHNGIKFKMISATGTTGVWPTRTNFEDPNSSSGIALFGGIAESLGEIGRAVDRLGNLGNKPSPQSISPLSDDAGQNTGYFQAQLLQQFLEQYAMAKKNPANKHWRLVFDCPKTGESFVVTPIVYNVTKSQRSPMESLYQMQFKAWKRIQIAKGTTRSTKGEIQKLDPNFWQKFTNVIDSARGLMGASINVIKAVRSDFRKPFEALRQVSLLAKDFSGLAIPLSDLPFQIIQDSKSSLQAIGTIEDNVNSFVTNIVYLFDKKLYEDRKKNEGVDSASYPSGNRKLRLQLGAEASQRDAANPINNVFANPESNFEIFKNISPLDLNLSQSQRNQIQEAIELNSLMSIEEIKDIRKEIQNLALDISNTFGAGDEFFSKVYNRPPPKRRSVEMTIEEFELLSKLEEAVLYLNLLTASREFDDVRSPNSLEYVGGLALESEISFDSGSVSKYLAPVPFGLTIEQISARYLGDPDRYNEIVTINNLKSPYIDEDGFSYNFLSNGDEREFNISTNQNLFIGQRVQLYSSVVPSFTRKITGIEKITDTNYLISIDGVANMGILKASEGARIKAFLPGTVNSQNQIYIPSNEPIEQEPRIFDIPYLQNDDLTGVSKIDWLLDESGDIVLNSFGEVALANGTTNLIQALKMKVITKKGSLLSDPEYGLGVTAGIISNEIVLGDMVEDMSELISSDPRFESLENIEIILSPPSMSIKINVTLANGRGLLPINFSVPM